MYIVSVSGEPKQLNNSVIEFFDEEGVEKALFEKHVEKFKPSLIAAAFDNKS